MEKLESFFTEAKYIAMEHNKKLSRADVINLTQAIALALSVHACGTSPNLGTETARAASTEIVPTPFLYPVAQPIYPQDVDVLFKGHEDEYGLLGIGKEDVRGAYFEGSFLFHFKDNQGYDYFYLNRGNTSEPKNTFEPLDFGSDIDGNYYLGPKLETYGLMKPKPDELKKYFIWNPNIETENTEMLVTYQPDGTSDTALTYRVPVQNSIQEILRERARVKITPDLELTDKERQIYSVAPETFATSEGDLQKSWSEKYGMPVYADKDGNIVAIWLADKRDLSKGSQRETTIKENVLTTIDDRGKEISIYPVVATAELLENEFNKVKIYTNGEKFRENPVLSQEQLPAMRDYLIELYNTKQLRQFEIGERGAMQLGPSYDKTPDFVMNPDNTAFLKENGYQSMFVVQDNERKTFRWENSETRPILVAFPYSEGGSILAQIILDKNNKPDVMSWYFIPQEWMTTSGNEVDFMQGMVGYKNTTARNFENNMLVPIELQDPAKYIGLMDDYFPITPDTSSFISGMSLANKDRRKLFEQMISTGIVPQEISNGEYINIWGGINVSK